MSNELNEFINQVTGEVIDLNNYIERNILERKKEGYKKYLDIRQNPFYWGHMNNIKILIEQNKIKLSTLGAVLLLGCYINHDDTLICKANKERAPYTTKEIRDNILKMSVATFKRFTSECKKTGILIIKGGGENAQYRVNKNFHFVGKQKDKKVSSKMVRIYKEGILSMYESGLSLEHIGFIYLILPYVDYKSCTLVNDPFDKNPTPMTYKEIGDLLNLSRATVSKYLNMTFEYNFSKSRLKSKYHLNAFGKFVAGTEVKYAFCVNPIILRRCTSLKGTIEYSKLENMFKLVGDKFE